MCRDISCWLLTGTVGQISCLLGFGESCQLFVDIGLNKQLTQLVVVDLTGGSNQLCLNVS